MNNDFARIMRPHNLIGDKGRGVEVTNLLGHISTWERKRERERERERERGVEGEVD